MDIPISDYYNLAVQDWKTNEVNKAKLKALEIIKLDPNFQHAYILTAFCFSKEGDHKSSLKYFELALSLGKTEFALKTIAKFYFVLKDYSSASEYFRQANELYPNILENIKSEVTCYRRENRWEACERLIRRSLLVFEQDLFLLENYYKCLYKLNDYEGTKIYAQKVVNINPDDVWAHKSLFFVCYYQKEMNKAYHHIEEVKRLEGMTSYVLQAFSGWHFEMKEFELALNYFLAIDEKDRQDAQSCYKIGYYYYALKRYELARLFFLQALSIDNKNSDGHLGLYMLSQGSGIEQYNVGVEFLFKAFYENNFACFKYPPTVIFELIEKSDNPMLVYRWLDNIYFDKPSYGALSLNFSEISRVTKPLRQQFSLWENEANKTYSLLIFESILCFYSGDPIKSYEILKKIIQNNTEKEEIPMIGYYYYVLSAQLIMEDHYACLSDNAVPGASVLLKSKTQSKIDLYYCALIFELNEEQQLAEDILRYLVEHNYVAAKYALARIKKTAYATIDEYEINELEKLDEFYRRDESYFKKRDRIRLDGLDDFIKLMPLFHLMENKIVLEDLYAFMNYKTNFDEMYYFNQRIHFSHLEDMIGSNYLEHNNPIIYNLIYGTDEEVELIESELAIFKIKDNKGSGLEYFANIIHKSAFTDYEYIRSDLKLPPLRTNYRHYLLLAVHLHSTSLINDAELEIFQGYLRYCAEAVYQVSRDNEILKIGISELKGHIIKYTLFGLSYGALESLAMMSYKKIKGNVSGLVTFQEFQSLCKGNL